MIKNLDDALLISSQFDSHLVALGDWSIEQRRLLNEWLEQETAEQKARVAAQVIASFALDILRNDASIEGKVRIKKLQSTSSLLERFVFTARELERKFYRDHINHMLKVALLARAIAVREPFCLDAHQLKTLTLAAIFHDIAYPISECSRIFNETLKALKNCYKVAEFFTNTLFRETDFDVASIAELIHERKSKVIEMLDHMNHGLLSAIEFQSFLKKEAISSYSEAIRAIAIHDSGFETEIDALKDPIIALLIIADELQDWGRPTDQNVSIIPRIEDFVLQDGKLSGRFIIKDPTFSILKQICSKMKNLQRISLNSDEFEFSILYDAIKFEKIDHQIYESVLQILFESVNHDLMNPDENIDLSDVSLFEKGYFGTEITMAIKKTLYEYLKNGQDPLKNPLTKINIFLNENKSELVLSEKALHLAKSIELSNRGDDKISTKILTDDGFIKGKFHEYDEKLNYFRFLAAEVRFINYMIHEIGSSKVNSISGFPKLEGIAESSVIKKAAKRLGKEDFIKIYDELRLMSVRRCLKNRSCFFL